MPAYTVTYRDKDQQYLSEETIHMKSLSGAKTSASNAAPECAAFIEINVGGH
ncbi:hypothetical protein MD535_22150 [Vibrio sp. ZSDZ65]|uniref:Uncharacterized protein n=1 Tax=Vibrio qingdaonensis TaxID=2829491 RepID=A0A9X3HYS4_9VIBR|nr:hypothetical protein [Vibrio qingdaonensis]MCW8348694.1 hypothetical protein [Vibrio qingdaonensis]